MCCGDVKIIDLEFLVRLRSRYGLISKRRDGSWPVLINISVLPVSQCCHDTKTRYFSLLGTCKTQIFPCINFKFQLEEDGRTPTTRRDDGGGGDERREKETSLTHAHI